MRKNTRKLPKKYDSTVHKKNKKTSEGKDTQNSITPKKGEKKLDQNHIREKKKKNLKKEQDNMQLGRQNSASSEQRSPRTVLQPAKRVLKKKKAAPIISVA